MTVRLREINDPENLLILAGEADFQPRGETGWIDFGMVLMHQQAIEATRKSIKRATRGGLIVTSNEVVTSIAMTWTVEMQQQLLETAEFILWGQRDADYVQAATSGATTSFTSKVRRAFDLGQLAVSNVVAKTGAEVWTEEADYTVDYPTGRIYIPEGSRIADGTVVQVTFDYADMQMASVTGPSRGNVNGVLRIRQWSENVLYAITEIPCALSCESADKSGLDDDPPKFRLRAMALGLVRRRFLADPDAFPEYLLDEDGELFADDDGAVLLIA